MAIKNPGRIVTLKALALYNQEKTLADDERYALKGETVTYTDITDDEWTALVSESTSV